MQHKTVCVNIITFPVYVISKSIKKEQNHMKIDLYLPHLNQAWPSVLRFLKILLKSIYRDHSTVYNRDHFMYYITPNHTVSIIYG